MTDRDAAISPLRWEQAPKLKSPVFLVGFKGWADAGGVASDTLSHVIEALQPLTMAYINNESFMIQSLERPVAKIESGLLSSMGAMDTSLKFWVNPDGPSDLVLMLAPEPHYNWLSYGDLIAGAMAKLGATHLITIGGVQDTVSHSAAATISVVCSSSETLSEQLRQDPSLNPADYEGPISVHTALLIACARIGIESTGLWAHVPAYLQKNPRQVARLVSILNKSIGMDCSAEDLKRESIELDRRIDEALAMDPNLREFVETIEDKEKREGASSSGKDKIIRLNDFLRREPQRDPEQ
jgi:proteasome assembly chaperone (PAC2) family protein